MKTEQDVERFVQRVARIQWMSAPSLTDEAETLLFAYAEDMRALTRHFAATRGFDAFATDLHICGVGTDTPQSGLLIRELFALPIRVPVREHLIFNLHACFFWDTDEDLRAFGNAYEPLMQLYELGYTTSGGPRELENVLDMTLGWSTGMRDYVFAL